MDENRVREDLEKLRQFYDSKGFFLAEITDEVEKITDTEVRLTFRIREEKKIKLRRITFIGNKLFSDKKLKSVIQTKEKGLLSFMSGSGSYQKELFALDRQLLRDFYGSQGYIKVKVGQPRVQLSPNKKSLLLTIPIEEGDRYTVSSIDVDGVLLKPREELMEVIKLKDGKFANTVAIQLDIAKLSTIYADEGYAYANVIPRDNFNEKNKTVGITYLLQPGPKVYVERIKITGNSDTRDKVIRREMHIMEGDLFSATKLRESRENIERLSLFEEVAITTPRGTADDRVNILINVKEQPTGTFSIGAGFNTLESFQVIGQVQKRNLFGYGVDITLSARIGGRTQAFNLRYRDEYFLDTKVGITVNAFNVERRFPDFDQRSRGGSLGFDYPFYRKGIKRIRGGLTYSLVDEKITDIRSTVEQLFDAGLTSSLTGTISRDTRNRVFEPSQGSFLFFTQEIAGGPLGGDNQFAKTEFDGRWFFPLMEKSRAPLLGNSVIGFHFRTGYVTPLTDGGRVPVFERFAPGGIFTLRGFDLRSLGPEIQVASSSDPSSYVTTDFRTGGNKQIIFNAEYIMPIVRARAFPLKLVFFFDMGNAFDNGESMFTLTGQRQSTGIGIRWFSPIGPLRFAWGFPLDRKEDESAIVFDFTIGSLF